MQTYLRSALLIMETIKVIPTIGFAFQQSWQTG